MWYRQTIIFGSLFFVGPCFGQTGATRGCSYTNDVNRSQLAHKLCTKYKVPAEFASAEIVGAGRRHRGKTPSSL